MSVTHMSQGTCGVTHGPITRPDPNRSEPALLQLQRGETSPSILTQGDAGAREAADHAAVTSQSAWMGATTLPLERRDGRPHPAERSAVACPDIDLDAEVPCGGLWLDDFGCRSGQRVADLIVRSHTWTHPILTCRPCWDLADVTMWCPLGRREVRSDHFTIVEVLR